MQPIVRLPKPKATFKANQSRCAHLFFAVLKQATSLKNCVFEEIGRGSCESLKGKKTNWQQQQKQQKGAKQ
jgi:uncharacterized Fe-S cluster-containing protein